MVTLSSEQETQNRTYAYWTDFFNQIEVNFSNSNNYVEEISKYEDPILKHIALYVVENYKAGEKYFRNGDKEDKACYTLNRWLDQKRNFFTSGKKCKNNADLWDKTIEELWTRLYTENNKKLCLRKSNTTNGYPHILGEPNCYKHIPENDNYFDPKETPSSICQNHVVPSTCTCPAQVICPAQVTSSEKDMCPEPAICNCDTAPSMHESHTSLECNYTGSKELDMITSSSFTFFGTCILFFILSKFTPLISWLYSRKIKGKMGSHYTGEEDTYDILGSYSGNYNSHGEEGRNNILYYSALN
ncbi:PIR protein [Plasmodium ovale]|uniref:PIR Superfamily Protein n=2 Tax=Plasmodium ovale TaxID=36330 RepID=A0A1A8VS61_PLAOA|nr:PIR Superfamily Protein [Plasmodium ovale curtisi]SBT01073.1 PIR Superfamily Protein [Plasmodium ovale curtisi]SBT83422.1 PIR protein [Plasmodium ovale]